MLNYIKRFKSHFYMRKGLKYCLASLHATAYISPLIIFILIYAYPKAVKYLEYHTLLQRMCIKLKHHWHLFYKMGKCRVSE